MVRTSGSPAVRIGLIDGPVLHDHPALAGDRVVDVFGGPPLACRRASSRACMHGTLVAGVLMARRGSGAPAICPACTLLVRPIFDELVEAGREPRARAEELVQAIEDVVRAGARIVNVSAALVGAASTQVRQIDELLTDTARRGVIVVAAAGNNGTVGSSAITRHRAVIPVVACGLNGRPTPQSNLSGRIGQTGLCARRAAT
jgi:subtilisin family serine protease